MVAATTTRTTTAVEAMVALLARQPPPLVPTVGPMHRGRPMATHGRGIWAPCPLDSNVRMPSWPHRTSTHLPASCPGHSSSSRCTSTPPQSQDGTPGSAQAGTSSRWPTPSAPWRTTGTLPRSRTEWRTSARRTTPSVGNISTLHPLASSNPSSIVVGNGSYFPITSVGDSILPGPFYLNNIFACS
jgi:hypothetical protein